MDIQDVKKQVCEALDRLEADAAEEAMEKVMADPKALLASMFGENIYLHVAGIGYRGQDLPPLTCYLKDMYGEGNLQTFNPIDEVLGFIQAGELDWDEAQEMIARSIAALQHGIDRLRDYEALRLKAQS